MSIIRLVAALDRAKVKKRADISFSQPLDFGRYRFCPLKEHFQPFVALQSAAHFKMFL